MSFDRWIEDRVDTARKELGGGHYVELAKHISGPDKAFISNAGLVGVKQDRQADGLMDAGDAVQNQTVVMDMRRLKLARMYVYIKGWNAKKADGSSLKLEQSAIDVLSVGAFDAIDKAIDEHIAEMAAGKAPASTSGEAQSTSADT